MEFVNKSAAGDNTLTPEEQAAANAMMAKVQADAKARANQLSKEAQLIESQRGEALAELAISEARGQANAWVRFYRDMLKLTAEGRAGFRKVTAKHAKDIRAHVKANNETDDYKGAQRSALVRLSELNTISKALDNNAKMDADWPFHYAVGFARDHMNKQGSGDTRGRKADNWMDKLKKFVAKNVPADKLHDAAELVETLATINPKA